MRHYWPYAAGRFLGFRGARVPPSSCVAPFTLSLDRGMGEVAQCAAPPAGIGAAGGLVAQPIFFFQLVEGSLYRVIRGQAAPLLAAHIARRDAVFERPAFRLDRPSLRRPQPAIRQESLAAPGMGFETFAPGRRSQRRLVRDGAGNALRRAVRQMKDQRQRRNQLVELRQALPDDRFVLIRYSQTVHILDSRGRLAHDTEPASPARGLL
jgi:hypothetical protein